jgi:type III secretion system FlhB-like substrate exporter
MNINMNDEILSFLCTLEQTCSEHKQMLFSIKDARNLIAHGESAIAFENIVDNLYEFEIPLQLSQFEVVERVAKSLHMESKHYLDLHKQIEQRL